MKTLQHAGFHVQYFAEGNEQTGDVIFMASLAPVDFHQINRQQLNDCCRQIQFDYTDLVTATNISVDDAPVLTDDKPQLEKLHVYWAEQWRNIRIKDYAVYLSRKKIPLFN
jgi:hypothetical protein